LAIDPTNTNSFVKHKSSNEQTRGKIPNNFALKPQNLSTRALSRRHPHGHRWSSCAPYARPMSAPAYVSARQLCASGVGSNRGIPSP